MVCLVLEYLLEGTSGGKTSLLSSFAVVATGDLVPTQPVSKIQQHKSAINFIVMILLKITKNHEKNKNDTNLEKVTIAKGT